MKILMQGYLNAKHIGLECIIATVVSLDGSSYRRPGVRMLITENGQMTGAVSGGCVEKEILKQADSVFRTGAPKMMTYDGRYRLGCEGTLYILIERFAPSAAMVKSFEDALAQRVSFEIRSYFSREPGSGGAWGSSVNFGDGKVFPFDQDSRIKTEELNKADLFFQRMKPCFRLCIIGAEHDAAQLSLMASGLGWEVTVVVSPSDPQTVLDFPGSDEVIHAGSEDVTLDKINEETAVVLMTHSYVKDLQFLYALKETRPVYIGLLGPSNRRERMLNDLMEKYPDIDVSFFDRVYGPTGLNIGAETPQEIALSICAEILSVIRGQEPQSLKDKTGRIHYNLKL